MDEGLVEDRTVTSPLLDGGQDFVVVSPAVAARLAPAARSAETWIVDKKAPFRAEHREFLLVRRAEGPRQVHLFRRVAARAVEEPVLAIHGDASHLHQVELTHVVRNTLSTAPPPDELRRHFSSDWCKTDPCPRLFDLIVSAPDAGVRVLQLTTFTPDAKVDPWKSDRCSLEGGERRAARVVSATTGTAAGLNLELRWLLATPAGPRFAVGADRGAIEVVDLVQQKVVQSGAWYLRHDEETGWSAAPHCGP